MARGGATARTVRRGVVPVALTLLLTVAACSSSAPEVVRPDAATATTSSAADRAPGQDAAARTSAAHPQALTDEQVLEVVSAMDAALDAGDVETYLTHVSPELEQEQRSWFEAVRSVPMDVRQLRADKVLSRTSPNGTVLHVALRHQITGADSTPMLQKYRWVLAPGADGRPVLVEVRGGNGLVHGYPQLWDLGPVAVLEAENVMLLAPESARPAAEELLPGIDAAAQELLQDFPALAEQRDVLVVQLVQPDVLAQMLDAAEGEYPAGASWLRTARTDPGLDQAYLGPTEDTLHPRLIFDLEVALDDLETWGEGPGGSTYIRYAGAVAAALGESERSEPVAWLLEGMPLWYELEADPALEPDLLGIAASAHADGPPEQLPSVTWSEEEEFTLQAASVSFVRYLQETLGRDDLVSLVDELSALDMWADEGEVWPAVSARVGRTEEQLLQDWQDWGEELLTRAEPLEPEVEQG